MEKQIIYDKIKKVQIQIDMKNKDFDQTVKKISKDALTPELVEAEIKSIEKTIQFKTVSAK